MQCNIDARGKAARLTSGLIMIGLGALLLGLRLGGAIDGDWAWYAGGAAVAFGGFGVFEARAGWCVVRALGFRTPV